MKRKCKKIVSLRKSTRDKEKYIFIHISKEEIDSILKRYARQMENLKDK